MKLLIRELFIFGILTLLALSLAIASFVVGASIADARYVRKTPAEECYTVLQHAIDIAPELVIADLCRFLKRKHPTCLNTPITPAQIEAYLTFRCEKKN